MTFDPRNPILPNGQLDGRALAELADQSALSRNHLAIGGDYYQSAVGEVTVAQSAAPAAPVNGLNQESGFVVKVTGGPAPDQGPNKKYFKGIRQVFDGSQFVNEQKTILVGGLVIAGITIIPPTQTQVDYAVYFLAANAEQPVLDGLYACQKVYTENQGTPTETEVYAEHITMPQVQNVTNSSATTYPFINTIVCAEADGLQLSQPQPGQVQIKATPASHTYGQPTLGVPDVNTGGVQYLGNGVKAVDFLIVSPNFQDGQIAYQRFRAPPTPGYTPPPEYGQTGSITPQPSFPLYVDGPAVFTQAPVFQSILRLARQELVFNGVPGSFAPADLGINQLGAVLGINLQKLVLPRPGMPTGQAGGYVWVQVTIGSQVSFFNPYQSQPVCFIAGKAVATDYYRVFIASNYSVPGLTKNYQYQRGDGTTGTLTFIGGLLTDAT